MRIRARPNVLVALTSAVLLLATPPPGVAQPVALELCTADKAGNYYAAGEEIRKLLDPDRVSLNLIETAGSWANLTRMVTGQCNAAIVQIDAYLVFRNDNDRSLLDITRPYFLYDEYIHLVCKKDSGVQSLQALSGTKAGSTILVGEPDSGSATSWKFIRAQDISYVDVEFREVGGATALDQVLQGEAKCMMAVSGLRSPFFVDMDARGAALALVPAIDSDLLGQKIGGLEVYGEATIAGDTYVNLQAGTPVKTISVGATMIVDRAWSQANAKAFDALMSAVAKASPKIKERVAAK